MHRTPVFRRCLRQLVVIAVIAVLMPCAVALPNPFPEGSITALPPLPSGLRIIVKENHALPIVAMAVVIRTGAAVEGTNGVAHFFEHLACQGSRNFPSPLSAQFALEACGGTSLAVTSRDAVRFQAEVPTEGIEQLVASFADLTLHPLLNASACVREGEIIAAEIAREADMPLAESINTAYALSYPDHPYRYAPKGGLGEVARIDAEQVRAFHRTWCVPNNISVLFVGDITPQRALTLTQDAFGNAKRADLPSTPSARPHQPEHVPTLHVARGIEGTYQVLALPAPSGRELSGFIAAQALASLLVDGPEAILPAQWAKDGIAVSNFGVEYLPTREPGRIFLWAQTSPQSAKRLYQSTQAAFAQLRSQPLPQQYVTQAKQRLAIRYLLTNETFTQQLETLVKYDTIDRAQYAGQYLSALQRLTPEHVQSYIPTAALAWVTLGQFPKG